MFVLPERTKGVALLLTALLLAAASAAAAEPASQRIVFIGDSITDGHTYPLLVRQALVEANLPAPVCINAGVAGDTAAGMKARIERDVLVHHPTLVTLSVGINDVLRGVKPAGYEADVREIARQLRERKIPLLVLTTTALGAKHAEADGRLAEFNAILRKIAAENDYQVAEVNALMQAARSDGAEVLEPDEVHLTFAGYRVMTRAVLDALGHKEVAVPAELKAELMPGVVMNWKVRVAPADQPSLTEKEVAELRPDDRWRDLALPESKRLAQWWQDQERQRGFAQSLAEAAGTGQTYQGFAEITTEKPREVYFNTGAQLSVIWLNGRQIYKSEGWTGWHAGKERVPATLEIGKNTVIIEAGGSFFLSITDDNDW